MENSIANNASNCEKRLETPKYNGIYDSVITTNTLFTSSQKIQRQSSCPTCSKINLKNHLLGRLGQDGENHGSGFGEEEQLYHFTTSEKCQFCLIVSHALFRRLELSGKHELVQLIKDGYEHHLVLARFSFEDQLTDTHTAEVSDSLGLRSRVYLKANFHQHVVGDSGGIASIGAAFFSIKLAKTIAASGSPTITVEERNHEVGYSSNRAQNVGENVNWDTVNGWLQICRESHTERCHCAVGPVPLYRPARVIDVQTNCIVETQFGADYLALSYVWGQSKSSTPMPTANRSSIVSLQTPGALIRSTLPNTISDAMYACEQLGQRYLWVDSLCIVQDDEDDVKEQIARMSDIYSGAFLTIIASCGEHAYSGLPGVIGGAPRRPQLVTNFDGIELLEVLPLLDDVLQPSSWKKRAWTQQEWLLSNRRLYFTHAQVYFECKTTLNNEDPWVMKADHDGTPRKSGNEGYLKYSEPDSPHNWIRFRNLLEEFTYRDLSFNDDIFNACTGIYQFVFGPNAKRFVFGLPESNFVEALRWVAFTNRRTERIPEHKDFVLPTWSWASFTTPISWIRGHNYLSYEASTEEGPCIRSLVSFKVCLDQNQGYRQLEMSEPELDRPSTTISNKNYPSLLDIHQAVPGRLLFRTQSALLYLRGSFGWIDRDSTVHRLDIYDKHGGGKISDIKVDLQWALDNVKKKPSNRRSAPQFKFIALSAICFPSHWTISHLDDYVSRKDISVIEEVDQHLDYWLQVKKFENDEDISKWVDSGDGKHLHVMLIEKHGDVFRRVGIASVDLAFWLRSDPKLEDIVLE